MVVLDPSILQNFKTGMIAIIIAALLSFLVFLLSLISVIRSQKSGLVKFNWIIFQLIFPIIGPLIYLIFGREKTQRFSQGFTSQNTTLSRASTKLESVFSTPENNIAKSVTTSQTEDMQQTSQLKTGSIFEQEKSLEINARLQQAVDYVKTSIAKGFTIEKIKEALRKSGWREEDIADAIISSQKK